MKDNLKFFVVVALLSMGIVGSCIPTQLASAQTASQHADLGPTPSTWQFDQSGHLTSVPERLEAKYDGNGRLQDVRIHEDDTPRTTTYAIDPGKTPGAINVRIVSSETKGGKDTVIYDHVLTNLSGFELAPYCTQVQEHGQLVRISLAEALKADPSTILIGVTVTLVGSGSQSTPFFVGGKYGARIGLW